jgi:hypothetical protein
MTAFSCTGYPRLPLTSQTPIRPFTLQDSRFIASNRVINDLPRIIIIPQLDVSFLFRNQGSHPTPFRRYSSAWWAEFPQAKMPEAVRQLTNPQKHYLLVVEIKIVILYQRTNQDSNAYIFLFVF